MKEGMKMFAKLSCAFVAILLGGQMLNAVVSMKSSSCDSPCVPGSESIMSPKAHGTSNTPVQQNLRWNCDWDTADRICNFNRTFAFG